MFSAGRLTVPHFSWNLLTASGAVGGVFSAPPRAVWSPGFCEFGPYFSSAQQRVTRDNFRINEAAEIDWILLQLAAALQQEC